MLNLLKRSIRFIVVILSALILCHSIASKSEENSIQNERKSISKEELIKAEEEMNRLEGLITQKDNFLERPRRRFVGARTKDYLLASYVEAWRKKVEKVGNATYPKAAVQEHLYGKVQVTVSIMANGTLEGVEINKSSGHKVLDDHVLYTIRLAAPFAKFSDDIKKSVDILSITRTWQYLNEQKLNGAENWFLEEVEN